jgi:hypothetical protein
MFEIKRGDTRPIYIAQLKEKVGTPQEKVIDLEAEEVESVRFIMRKKDASGAPDVDGIADIDDAKEGLVSYTWEVGDTDRESGEYDVEFELKFKDGGTETVPDKLYFACKINPDLDH